MHAKIPHPVGAPNDSTHFAPWTSHRGYRHAKHGRRCQGNGISPQD